MRPEFHHEPYRDIDGQNRQNSPSVEKVPEEIGDYHRHEQQYDDEAAQLPQKNDPGGNRPGNTEGVRAPPGEPLNGILLRETERIRAETLEDRLGRLCVPCAPAAQEGRRSLTGESCRR
jgi:hypothetical protein